MSQKSSVQFIPSNVPRLLTPDILSLSPIGPLAPVTGTEAQIAAGVAVYRNNVRAAYLRVLADIFPVVQRLVGEDFFRYLAHEYFHTYTPSSRIVARYGDALPDFLENFERTSNLQYLPDVARFELAWLGAYHAAEAVSLLGADIFAAIGDDPDRARFSVHPSMRLISSPFPVHSIWVHNRNQNPGPLKLEDAGERSLLVRAAHKVETSVVSRGVFKALISIASGAAFGEALGRAIEAEPDAELPILIGALATSGVITAVSMGSSN